MQCSTCGMDNQSATRFCIHCGAAQTPAADAGNASTVIAAMAQAGSAKAAPVAPPWGTPSGTTGAREDAAGTGLHTPIGGDSLATPATPPFAQDAGATGAVRAGTIVPPPAAPEAVAFESGDEPSLLTPPAGPTSAPGPGALPAFSDATAFTMPASRAAPAGAADRAGESADPVTSHATSWVEEPADPYASPAARSEPPGTTAQPPLVEPLASMTHAAARSDATGVLPRSSLPPPSAPPLHATDDHAVGAGLPPAYDAAPRHRSGMLIVVGLAVLALLGIGGFFFYQMSQDRAAAGAPVTADAGSRSPGAPAAGEATTTPDSGATTSPQAGDATPAPAAPPPATPSASDVDSAKAAPAPSTSATTPAVEPPEKRPAPRAPTAKATRPAAPVPPPPPPPVEEPAAAPTPPVARPAPAPAPQRATDRWAQMGDELTRCRREDFINRVVCDQRVRLRYCDGYWGKVPQCPAAPQADHGQ